MARISDEDVVLEDFEMMPREYYMRLYKTVGAALEVYRELGKGMEEPIYQEALEMELAMQNINFVPQAPLHTWYKGKLMKKEYFADIIAYSDIVVELKSVNKICKEHRAQLFNYLRITKQKCGALINYGDDSFYCERYWFIEKYNDYFLLTKDNLNIFVKKE